MAIAGDSAGGNLAAVIATMGVAPLRFQLLVYPVTDLRGETASHIANAEGYFLTKAAMEWFGGHYLTGGAGTADDPRVSPLLANDDALRSGPPAMVITAEYDPLRDEGEAYAARLSGLGVPCTAVRFGGQIHAFFSLPGIDDGDFARLLAGAALRRALA
jgi:acetyl esterase